MRARKRYGQHFLEAAWADRVVEVLHPQPVDRFIEIGPGIGALTRRLAPRVSEVTAVEVDPAMVEVLRPTLPANVTLLLADFLEWDLDVHVQPGVRVAGNLPYNVSSPILFKLLRSARATGGLLDATLMMQREVAERIDAIPGTKAYGVLAILVRRHADVRRLLDLPPGAFRPAPRVHSTVIGLTFKPPEDAVTDETLFERMVRSMFTQRRKTLLNALRPFASAQGTDAGTALRRAGIDGVRRGETLQVAELARLANVFASP